MQRPTGLARRRRRLSDEETERRMLQAAVDMVNATGLTVSLEHLSFEDVIRAAGVSRSAVYRRWPYKDLFFSDLLKKLATAAGLATVADREAGVRLVRHVALDRLDWLKTPELRRELCIELFRQGALRDFETLHESTEWRTYLALHATFLSLPDGQLRNDIQRALAHSEQGIIARGAKIYQRLSELLGYRLRAELDTTFETLASLASATMRGLVIMAPAVPDIATRHIQAAPFGAAQPAEWSQPALGIASIALSFLEPDPTIEWNDERLAKVREALMSEAPTVLGPGG